MNKRRLHINNSRFTILVVTFAKQYNLKTVGQLENFVMRFNPCQKVAYTHKDYVRASKIQKELETFLSNND